MSVFKKLSARSLVSIIPMILLFLFCPTGLRAQLIVDCTGANPFAFPSINSAVQSAPERTLILVTGPCNENVNINAQLGLDISAMNGQPVTINGSINIMNSTSVFLFGLNVTNPAGNGINVTDTHHVFLDTCTSNGNSGVGLSVGGFSSVVVLATGAFDNNARGGMNITGNSLVALFAFAGTIDISNNGGAGVFASQANFSTLGNTTLKNNAFGGQFNPGFGLDLRGGAHAQIGALFGPNILAGNQSGGASLQETAEISFFSIGQPNLIQGNGPVGVLAGFGSQVTFANISGPLAAQITDHTSAGVDLFANSQAFFLGSNQVLRNGAVTDPRSAGIRVDGNSEAFLRGGQVAQNNGPGILALVNSSADFTGVSFAGNAQGEIITCDSSSWMVSDLAQPNSNPPAGVRCRTPHALGNRQMSQAQPTAPDWRAYKALHDKLVNAAIRH